MQGQPVATNEWFSNAIFTQYTGELWAYPQIVEVNSQGVKIAMTTDFYTGGNRSVEVRRDAYVVVSGTVEADESSNAQIILDFEDGGYGDGWVASGDFATNGPRTIAGHNHSGTPEGYLGSYYFDSYFDKGDANLGRLVYSDFTPEYDYLHFLVAGGSGEGVGVRLIADDEVVCEARGENSISFHWASWDLRPYVGKELRIEIVDDSRGGWGWIGCDNFVLSNDSLPNSNFSTSFWPQSALAYDWSDISFTFSLQDDRDRGFVGTLVHGVPFTYLDAKGINPIVTLSEAASEILDMKGQSITNTTLTSAGIVARINGQLFGIHLPQNTSIEVVGQNIELQFDTSVTEPYMVVSAIPSEELIGVYDAVARNKVTDTRFSYQVSSGKIETAFHLETLNYDTGAAGGNTIMSFIPHQWRNTQATFSYIDNATYTTLRGEMKSAQGTDFALEYAYGGMPPFMPKPMNLTAEQTNRLHKLIDERVKVSAGYNGNTYAKGLGEESSMMIMARELCHSGYSTLKENLKKELIDWLTFSEEESNKQSYYFTEYPDYGALIGFPPGYGSQGFNDLHFHNGYFIIGAARLMMVDQEFKEQYGSMVKLVARSYANWMRDSQEHIDLPYLRNFDPYFGHSFAGGTGDGGGNNQESTSESLNAWFGIYALGVAMNDREILELGATGYLLESKAADTYWFDRYGDIPEEYPCEYVGITRTGNFAMATYFNGDPAWAFGIQFVPCDHYYNYTYDNDSAHYRSILNSMIEDRVTYDDGYFTSTDVYDNIVNMGPYLGGYVLNHMQTYAPYMVASMLDTLYVNEGGEWTNHVNVASNYYISNANITYGYPAKGYYTNSPTSAVFKDAKGELSYVFYNATTTSQTIRAYDPSGTEIKSVELAAGAMYNSKETSPKPQISFSTIQSNDVFVQHIARTVAVDVFDKDGNVEDVKLFINDSLVAEYDSVPYTYSWIPRVVGEQQLKAVVIDTDNQTDTAEVRVMVIADNQQPFHGTPFNVPTQVIPAVEWDWGNELISYKDNDKDNKGAGVRQDEGVDTEGGAGLLGNIGWTEPDEWLEYTIRVDSTGWYDMAINYSSAYDGGQLRFYFDDVATEVFSFAKTANWADYQDGFARRIHLDAGEQVMRVYIVSAGMNLKSFRFEASKNDTRLEGTTCNTLLFPNPVEDRLFITWENEQPNEIILLTMNGTCLYRSNNIHLSDRTHQIDMSGFYDGMYLVVLKNDKQYYINKIIKKKRK